MDCNQADKQDEEWQMNDADEAAAWFWWPEESWSEDSQQNADEGIDENDANYINQKGKGKGFKGGYKGGFKGGFKGWKGYGKPWFPYKGGFKGKGIQGK